MNLRLVIAIGAALAASPAQAHWGHLGELAGHGHWAGLAAVLAGGAIAAWLIKDHKQTDNETENADTEAETEVPDEAAEAV